MRRQALLANAAATASAALPLATAGCLTTDDASTKGTPASAATDTRTGTSKDVASSPGTESPTDADGSNEVGLGDTVTVEGVDLDLGGISLQSSFVEHLWPSWDAEAPTSGLYAVLPVTASEEAMSLYDDPPLGTVVDGDPWTEGGPTVAAMDDEVPVRFAVPVPTGDDVEDVALAIDEVERTRHYPLRDDLLATLREPPSFTVTPDIPDTVGADDSVTFSVTVANTGNSPGTLAFAVTHDDIHDKYWTRTVRVDPGTERTTQFAPAAAVPGDVGLEVRVDWGLDSFTKTVTAEPEDTTSGDA